MSFRFEPKKKQKFNIGRTINFVYGDINDSFKIVAHDIKEQKVKIGCKQSGENKSKSKKSRA